MSVLAHFLASPAFRQGLVIMATQDEKAGDQYMWTQEKFHITCHHFKHKWNTELYDLKRQMLSIFDTFKTNSKGKLRHYLEVNKHLYQEKQIDSQDEIRPAYDSSFFFLMQLPKIKLQNLAVCQMQTDSVIATKSCTYCSPILSLSTELETSLSALYYKIHLF